MLIMLVEVLGYSWNIGWSHCGPLLQRKIEGLKNVRPMKAPTFENAYLDRTRRTRKKKSCRQKTLLIIRQYDTRLQPQHFLRQHAWRQQRVAQRTRSKELPTATNERRVAAVADRFSAKGVQWRSDRSVEYQQCYEYVWLGGGGVQSTDQSVANEIGNELQISSVTNMFDMFWKASAFK